MSDSTELFPPRAWIPNAVTGTAIALGFMSFVLAAQGEFDRAVYVLWVSILLDMLDGKVARFLKATSGFGQQLDSLADVLNFGAAPAFLLYAAQLHELGVAGLATAVIYLLAGTYRLARYNVCSDAHSKTRCTVGLPIPIAAAFLLAAVLIRRDLDAVWSGVVVISMVGFMVSRWRLPTLTGTDLVSMLLVLNLINYAVLVVNPSLTTAAWWFAWMLISALAASVRDRRLGLDQDAPDTAPEAR